MFVGTEILNSSRDLLSLSLTGRHWSCLPIDTRIFSIKTLSHEQALPTQHTCERYKGSHLLLLYMLRFTAAHKRRQRNRPYPIGLCPKWSSKELGESPFLILSLLLKAQCRLNLEKINKEERNV